MIANRNHPTPHLLQAFIIMTWLHSDLAQHLNPHTASYFSGGFYTGLVAVVFGVLSLGLKIRTYQKPRSADEVAAMKSIEAEFKRRQQLQQQGFVVLPMQYAPAGSVPQPPPEGAIAVPVGTAPPPGYTYMVPQQSVGAQGSYSAPPYAPPLPAGGPNADDKV